MNKKMLIGICAVLLSILLFIMYLKNIIYRPFKINSAYIINVNNGSSFYSVLNKLKNDDIIKNSFFIKSYIKYKNITLNIKPGKYVINKNMSIDNFISILNKGNDTSNLTVTIPEGYTIEQIADLLEKNKIVKKDEFIKSCKEYKLPQYIINNPEQRYSLEGYLFPDTYEFSKNVTSEQIIKIMLDRFNEVISEIQNKNNLKLDKKQLYKIMIISSIVQNEIKVNDERPLAASVFYNRLKKNMKLQSCATVLYAFGYHKSKLYEKDLKIESKYNTYIVDSLPPGPICSPGMDSINAAVNPADTDYLFFVSKNDGTHFFTNNYDKFLEVKKATQGF